MAATSLNEPIGAAFKSAWQSISDEAALMVQVIAEAWSYDMRKMQRSARFVRKEWWLVKEREEG